MESETQANDHHLGPRQEEHVSVICTTGQ